MYMLLALLFIKPENQWDESFAAYIESLSQKSQKKKHKKKN